MPKVRSFMLLATPATAQDAEQRGEKKRLGAQEDNSKRGVEEKRKRGREQAKGVKKEETEPS